MYCTSEWTVLVYSTSTARVCMWRSARASVNACVMCSCARAPGRARAARARRRRRAAWASPGRWARWAPTAAARSARRQSLREGVGMVYVTLRVCFARVLITSSLVFDSTARTRGARTGLPPGVDDVAALAADHVVEPLPGLLVDRLAHCAH